MGYRTHSFASVDARCSLSHELHVCGRQRRCLWNAVPHFHPCNAGFVLRRSCDRIRDKFRTLYAHLGLQCVFYDDWKYSVQHSYKSPDSFQFFHASTLVQFYFFLVLVRNRLGHVSVIVHFHGFLVVVHHIFTLVYALIFPHRIAEFLYDHDGFHNFNA